MKNKNLILLVILGLLIFVGPAHAFSRLRLGADDPRAKGWVAVDEFSPYPLLTFTSYVGALGAVFYFGPDEKSPDYGRRQFKELNGAAAGVILFGGFFNMVLGMNSPPLMSADERAKLGTLSYSDMDKDSLDANKNFFWASHILNTAALAIVASQSNRNDRWSVVAVQAALPFVVDVSARYIFGSKTVSPWALGIAPSGLMLTRRW